MRSHLRLCWLVVMCASCDRDEVPPAPPAAAPSPIGPFTTLIANRDVYVPPGDEAGVMLGVSSSSAIWWHGWPGDARSTEIPDPGPLRGARWIGPGQLGVGESTFDVATAKLDIEPAIRRATTATLHIKMRAVAWSPGGEHVAVLTDRQRVMGLPSPELRRPPGYYDTHEIFIIERSTGRWVVARTTSQTDPGITASEDRVLVTGDTTELLDMSGDRVTTAAPLPKSSWTSSYAADRFAIVTRDGVTLLEPRAGAIVAAWQLPGRWVVDAVPIRHGVVAVDTGGVVRIGCVVGGTIETVAAARTDPLTAWRLSEIQVVGNHIVVVDGNVRVAPFTNPCR